MSNQFGNFGDYERSIRAAHNNDINTPVSCRCGCTYFEEVRAQQYMANHNVIIGQAVPAVMDGTATFFLLRCIKCKELTEPRIQRMNADRTDKKYQEFLDQMEDVGGVKTEKV